jgi:hypothetical protein
MPDTERNPPEVATFDRAAVVAAVREALMQGLAPVDTVAEALGKSTRTIQRLVAQEKLPTVWVGRTPYIVLDRARQVLMTPKVKHAPVRRGRPVGRKAA